MQGVRKVNYHVTICPQLRGLLPKLFNFPQARTGERKYPTPRSIHSTMMVVMHHPVVVMVMAVIPRVRSAREDRGRDERGNHGSQLHGFSLLHVFSRAVQAYSGSRMYASDTR